MKPSEIREMSTTELVARATSLKEELFNLRFQLVTGKLESTARLREVRRSIAQCRTIIRERELKANA